MEQKLSHHSTMFTTGGKKMEERYCEVIGRSREYPDEDVILLYSGSESDCENYLAHNGGVYQEGSMVYDMELWEVEEDE